MANNNNFPNVWKDGYSSADHAEESYSPQAWERAQRQASIESQERHRAEELNSSLNKKQDAFYEARQSEYRRQARAAYDEQMSIYETEQRRIATNHMVQEKRDEKNKNSSLKKFWDKLRGKTFEQNRQKITAEIKAKVNNMPLSAVEAYNERKAESKRR